MRPTTKPAPKPRRQWGTTQTAVRMPNVLLDRLDELVKRLQSETGWPRMTRTKVVLDALTLGVERLEATTPAAPAATKRRRA